MKTKFYLKKVIKRKFSFRFAFIGTIFFVIFFVILTLKCLGILEIFRGVTWFFCLGFIFWVISYLSYHSKKDPLINNSED